ncbi:MAG TPA: ATP-dependent helicase HrpB, partial [Dongiaceae bacterium]|nr:ATP-dependent helicase HrpB [Dongiaceae bacterium]
CLVIFDEFHERSVNLDLGLAFALETQSALRDEQDPLKLLVMSATLDGERLSRWLDAPLVASEGRVFPVETHYAPLPVNTWPEQHTANTILRSLQQDSGNLLVFLPGLRELQRVKQRLEESELPANTQVFLLHASLPQDVQEQAIAPTQNSERKIVLSTNVAETSVTIEGIRVVIDSGQVRVARYDERSAMEKLETQFISAASAEQRRGRAGRMEPGTCYRLWSETAHTQLQAFTDPEILHADLAPVALELAQWGSADFSGLPLLNPPPADRYGRAVALLQDLDALDTQQRITAQGRQLTALGMHPRLATLVWNQRNRDTASAAIACAAILGEGDPLRFDGDSAQANLHLRLALWQSSAPHGQLQRGTWQRIQQLTQQTAKRLQTTWDKSAADHGDIGSALAQAFPDRVAQLRADSQSRYRMANGKGVQLGRQDALAGSPYLVILETDGAGNEPRVRLACPLTLTQLKTALKSHLRKQDVIRWNETRNAVEAEQQLQFGALVLERNRLPQPWPDAAQQCLLQALAQNDLNDLPWTDHTQQLLARLQWLHQQQPEQWPDVSRAALRTTVDTWLLPFLNNIYSFADLQKIDLNDALKNVLEWSQWQALDTQAPVSLILPAGTTRELDYAAENGPVLRARLQEFYGLKEHPTLPNGQRILLELLSPAQRPIQLTRDLPGFWHGSYKEVAKDMRGRYPKHYWPDDPASAAATTKTKRNM